MGLRIWGSLISESSSSYSVLLDCAADGEGNEYVIVQLPKDQIIETFLLHSIIQRGQIYGSHSDHTKYAQQQQQDAWLKRSEKQRNKNQDTSQNLSPEMSTAESVEPLRATHQIWGIHRCRSFSFYFKCLGNTFRKFQKTTRRKTKKW